MRPVQLNALLVTFAQKELGIKFLVRQENGLAEFVVLMKKSVKIVRMVFIVLVMRILDQRKIYQLVNLDFIVRLNQILSNQNVSFKQSKKV